MRKKLVTLADGTPCPICGKVMDDSLPKGHDQKPELDEIFPHVAGGAATAENSRIICRRCNRRKSDHLPGDPRSGDWYYTTRIPPPSYPGCPPYDDW
jgi:5-methylcytosine-specific restriction endonuclease McrA